MNILELIHKIPKGATVGIIFSIAVYLFDKQIITMAELTLLSNLAMVFGIGGSAITRIYGKK